MRGVEALAVIENQVDQTFVVGCTAWHRTLKKPELAPFDRFFKRLHQQVRNVTKLHMKTELVTVEDEARYEFHAVAYALKNGAVPQQPDVVCSAGTGSIQLTHQTRTPDGDPDVHGIRPASGLLNFNQWREHEKKWKDNNVQCPPTSFAEWEKACLQSINALVAGVQGPVNLVVCISGLYYAAVTSGLVEKTAKEVEPRLLASVLGELESKEKIEGIKNPRDRANVLRLRVLLRKITAINIENGKTDCLVLFGRDWQVQGRAWRTTWTSGYFLEMNDQEAITDRGQLTDIGEMADIFTQAAEAAEAQAGMLADALKDEDEDVSETKMAEVVIGEAERKRKAEEEAECKRKAERKRKRMEAEVRVMSKELSEKQIVVIENQKNVSELLDTIATSTERVSARQLEANELEKQIAEDAIVIERESAEAEVALQAAVPALEAAAKALEDLDKNDITEIESMASPPIPVMIVCMCVVILRPFDKEDFSAGWAGAKIMLSDAGAFLRALFEYNKDNIKDRQVMRIKDLLAKEKGGADGPFAGDNMLKISKAGHGLLCWVKAMIQYHEVRKTVEPKRKLVKELNTRKEANMDNMEKITKELMQLAEQIEKHTNDEKEQSAVLKELKDEADSMQRKLHAASQLIEGSDDGAAAMYADEETYLRGATPGGQAVAPNPMPTLAPADFDP